MRMSHAIPEFAIMPKENAFCKAHWLEIEMPTGTTQIAAAL